MRPTRARLRMSARFLRVGELEGAGIDWERDPGFPEPPSMHFALRLKRFTKSAAQKKKSRLRCRTALYAGVACASATMHRLGERRRFASPSLQTTGYKLDTGRCVLGGVPLSRMRRDAPRLRRAQWAP